MTAYSKILHYSCYELGHTWNTSCTASSLELLISSFFDSMRLYGMVYMVSTLASPKKLSKEFLLKLLKNYFRSVTFLAVNGGGYVASFCVFRYFFQHINFFSASFLPGLLASVFAISIERPARRNALAIYVMNVASECFWNVLVDRGMVKPVPFGGAIVFAAAMTIFGYQFKKQKDFSSLTQSIFKFLIGKHEVQVIKDPQIQRQILEDRKSNQILNVGNFLLTKELNYKHPLCSHSRSCLKTYLMTFTKNFSLGYLFQLIFQLLPLLSKLVQKPELLWRKIKNPSSLKTALFLAWFSTSFQVICCVCRRLRDKDDAVHGAIAGGVAGLGLAISPSNTLTLYAFWKAAEGLYGKWMAAGMLPNIPYGVEFLYCLSTGYLFHVAMLENYNMTPTYWRFLINLTAGRIADYNRFVLNSFGLNSGKRQKWPDWYEHDHLSTTFKKEFADRLGLTS